MRLVPLESREAAPNVLRRPDLTRQSRPNRRVSDAPTWLGRAERFAISSE